MNRNQKIGLSLLGAAAGVGAYLLVKKMMQPVNPPEITKSVDLERYLGDWYDLAHYPVSFQRNCAGSMAHYSLNTDGTIRVRNTCYKYTLDGQFKEITGKAWVVDPKTNAKLKVQFFWPFSGDYWVLDHADDYSWAIVGHPMRKYIWILSRKPKLDTSTLDYVLTRVREFGYDLSRLEWEEQPKMPRTMEDNLQYPEGGLVAS